MAMYIVIVSVAHQSNTHIADCASFDEAVAAARDAGATGEPAQTGRGEWCFDGGTESVGYWITERATSESL